MAPLALSALLSAAVDMVLVLADAAALTLDAAGLLCV
jgi:hypothetical protein